MGVCCSRNVDEPVAKFLEKAEKEKLNIGKEDVYKRGIYSLDGTKSLSVNELKEIFTSQFVFNDQYDFYYYDFFVKDNKDKIYNIDIKINKKGNNDPIINIKELNEENTTTLTNPRNEDVVDYINYNTYTNSPKKVKTKPSLITLSKKDHDIFNEESKNVMSPRLTTLSSRSNDNNMVLHGSNLSSPVKSVKTDLNRVLTKFKANANKLNIPYGSDDNLIKAIELIEQKNKAIIEIETDIFEYKQTDSGIEYKFSFIESKNIRYVCDVTMDTEGDFVFLHKPNQKQSVDKNKDVPLPTISSLVK
jgi:hypothetical protein